MIQKMLGSVSLVLLVVGVAWGECKLMWDASSGEITGYRMYVSSDKQEVKDRVVSAIEISDNAILCTTVSLDLDDYAAVSSYDASGNESDLSNIVQRKNLVAPGNIRVRHFIEVTE
jgi:fibronectin type 3 domain-containing protein